MLGWLAWLGLGLGLERDEEEIIKVVMDVLLQQLPLRRDTILRKIASSQL